MLSSWDSFAPHPSGCWALRDPKLLTLRHGCDAKVRGAGICQQGLLPSTPRDCRVWGPCPQKGPHLNSFLFTTSSSLCFPANHPVSAVPNPVSYNRETFPFLVLLKTYNFHPFICMDVIFKGLVCLLT